jgi:hypothetical protein
MATQAQTAANRENAKLSTGPFSFTGMKAASRNALKHGLTSQTIHLSSPEEAEAYAAHVKSYMDHHKPTDPRHLALVQDLADSHWAIHQVFVHQTESMSLMSSISMQMANSGASATETAAALAPVARTLATLSTYEGRRRRAAKAIQQELSAFEEELAAEHAAAARNANKTNQQPEIGFVCPAPLKPVSPAEFARQCEELDNAMTLLEKEKGCVSDEELAELLLKNR